MQFRFHRFRFRFRAADSLYFPPGKSANILRGAFGTIFRKIACDPACRDAATCEKRATCPYARIFEPRAARGEGPSGLADWPRPFVFRAAHLDGVTVVPDQLFHFDLHVFDVRDPNLGCFVDTFAQLAQEGLGPRRGRAVLEGVEGLDLESRPHPPLTPVAIDLDAGESVSRVTVRFVTPTELKSSAQVVDRPGFPVLFARLRDRLSTLSALYADGPLAIDFRALAGRAEHIALTRCDLRHESVERRSSRTGQVHPLGGFTGEADYEGDLAEFLPYLRAGKWTGVGRQTVWGKGEIEVV